MKTTIRVKGARSTFNPNKPLAQIKKPRLWVMAKIVAHELNLLEQNSFYIEGLDKESEDFFKEDPDAFLQTFISTAVFSLEAVSDFLNEAYRNKKGTKWLADFSDEIFELILPNLQRVIEETDQTIPALVECVLLLGLERVTALERFIEWTIKYGPLDLITNDLMLNKLANVYHSHYIARLPGTDLFEFLTSEKEGARVQARNKIEMEAEGLFDEI